MTEEQYNVLTKKFDEFILETRKNFAQIFNDRTSDHKLTEDIYIELGKMDNAMKTLAQNVTDTSKSVKQNVTDAKDKVADKLDESVQNIKDEIVSKTQLVQVEKKPGWLSRLFRKGKKKDGNT